MRTSRRCLAAVQTAAMVSVLALSACDSQKATSSAETRATKTPTTPAAAKTADLSADDFATQRFDRSTVIDNEWLPMRPGTRLVYEGAATEGSDRIARKIIFIVTDLTKVISGVRAVVVWERDFNDGELIESELAFFTQDNDGNVWHLGQYPEEYEDGKLDAAPAWIHGLAGARAGITMKKEPKLGAPDYAQGYAPPPINWVDHGRVHEAGAKTCVPEDCYADVVVIEEYEPDIPQAFQDKYYAPGVGVVRVGWRGKNDESKEVLELVDFRTLDDEEMADVRADALALEERAYRISQDVWAKTPRAQGPAT